jgi:hypothetical protein
MVDMLRYTGEVLMRAMSGPAIVAKDNDGRTAYDIGLEAEDAANRPEGKRGNLHLVIHDCIAAILKQDPTLDKIIRERYPIFAHKLIEKRQQYQDAIQGGSIL